MIITVNRRSPNAGLGDADNNLVLNGRTLRVLTKLTAKIASTPVEKIRFSADGRAIITNTCYEMIVPPRYRPLQSNPGSTNLSLRHDYYAPDGWLWCGRRHEEAPRRVCWLPPVYRYQPSAIGFTRNPGGWDPMGEGIEPTVEVH